MRFKAPHSHEHPGEPVLLLVPYEKDRILEFLSPPITGCYITIAERIDELNKSSGPHAELFKPKFSHLVSLVHEAIQDPKEEHSAEIIRTLSRPENWLISFTGISYISYKQEECGIVKHHPEIKFGHLCLPHEELADKILQDPSIKIAGRSKDYTTQENVNPMENSFFQCAGSTETPKKLAEIARYFGSCTVVGLSSRDEEKSGYISMNVQSSAKGTKKFVIDVFSHEQNRTGFSYPIKV